MSKRIVKRSANIEIDATIYQDELADKAKSELRATLVNIADATAIKARELAPAGSGYSVSKIKTRKTSSKDIVHVLAGWKAPMQEYGTKRRTNARGANRGAMPRRPYMWPALDYVKGRLKQWLEGRV